MTKPSNEALFSEAVREHMGIFMKTAYAFALPADRDDLVQEMLLAVWEALPAYEGTSCKLSTFLYRVANNRAMNWNRSQRRYGRKLDAFQNCPTLTLDAGAGANEPDARLEWLYGLIRRLPPLDRTVLMLHLDRVSHREIGEVVGQTENHIGVRLHRIKKWLAEQKGTGDEL